MKHSVRLVRLSPLAALALAAVVQACAPKPPPVAVAHAPIYAEDLTGKAPNCVVSDVTVVDGKDAPATIATGGGGWCALSVSHDGAPYASTLLVQAPRNGRVFAHPVGDDTRIDYTPKTAPVQADSFAVQLVPGNAVIRVTVKPATAAPATGK